MATRYPQADIFGRVAAGLFVICMCVAIFAVVVDVTSGTTDHIPGGVVASTASGSGNAG